jgi:Zn-dependent protease with chaperone function
MVRRCGEESFVLTTLRAFIALVMLFGFYLFALIVVGGLGWLTVLAFSHDVAGASKLGYLTIIVAFGVLAALWQVIRAKPELPSGLPVSPQQAPELWGHVAQLSASMQTRPPDEILLVPEVNAAVTERTQLLGLIGGRRIMLIGVPLLQAFTVSQLRSVLAHELGHFSGSHTRLGPITYRGRLAVVGTVQRLGAARLLFELYARFYLMVEASVSRQQELEADRASVWLAGRSTAQSALRDLPVLDSAWDFYFGRYVAPGWEAGYAPNDIFGGFGAMLHGRAGEIAKLRAQAPPSKASRYDSHPPIAARIAAMESMPEAAVPVDTRPAWVLVPYFEQACHALVTSAFKIGNRAVVPWDQFTGLAMTATVQEAADEIYRAVARVTGGRADLGIVLDLAESGRLGSVGNALPDPDALAILVRLAAIRSGAAYWRHSWTGPATMIRPDGSPFDPSEIVHLVANPATVGAARARLAELGVDATKSTLVQAAATTKGATIVGGVGGMRVNGKPYDVLVLDSGLILVPGKRTSGGKGRLVSVAQLAQSIPVEELSRRYHFLAYEDVAAVTRTKKVPMHLQVRLHDGQTMGINQTLSGDLLTKDSLQLLANGLYSRVPASSQALAAR